MIRKWSELMGGIEHEGRRYHVACSPVNAYDATDGYFLKATIEDPEEICAECWEPLLGPAMNYEH